MLSLMGQRQARTDFKSNQSIVKRARRRGWMGGFHYVRATSQGL